MTYSIVARDPKTGELGVAVQTCMFAVGTIVPWARAGVGAVATQAIAEPAYGPRCLDAMNDRASAADALARARDLDPGSALRQVGVVDAAGNASAHTGDLCIDYAGHRIGEGCAVQANMMASPDVWPAMAEAYEHATGELGDRLLAALVAGELAGGDARGRMSAAILVVDGTPAETVHGGVKINLRVDDHPEPLDELARLMRVAAAFRGYGRATEALFSGNAQEALREIDTALALLPDDENLRFLRSGALAICGQLGESGTVLRDLIAHRGSWATVVRSFVAKGLFPVPDGVDIEDLTG